MQQPFAFDALSPEAVRRRLDAVDLEEKTKLAEGLALIALMDARGDYLEAGYSCMQKYCMGRLGMSEEKATKRLVVARAGRRHAGVFERIADGRLSVSVMVVLSFRLTESTASVLLAAAERRPRREVQKLLAELDRTPSTPTPSEPPTAAERMDESAEPTPSLADLLGPDTGMTEPSPGKVKTHVRGRVFETEQGTRGLRVELTEEEFADFTKVRDLLSHVIRNGDPADVLARALSIAAYDGGSQFGGALRRAQSSRRAGRGADRRRSAGSGARMAERPSTERAGGRSRRRASAVAAPRPARRRRRRNACEAGSNPA